MRLNPFLSLLRILGYILKGRLHFPKNRIGEHITTEDEQEFIIFRQAIVDPRQGQAEKPGAVFRVRFHVAHMSPKQNKLFSLLPIPFFIGLPGFRAKLWMVNEASGDSQGIYQWDTVHDAENYAHSFAVKFMTMRSVPGSVSYKITPYESTEPVS